MAATQLEMPTVPYEHAPRPQAGEILVIFAKPIQAPEGSLHPWRIVKEGVRRSMPKGFRPAAGQKVVEPPTFAEIYRAKFTESTAGGAYGVIAIIEPEGDKPKGKKSAASDEPEGDKP